MDDLMPSRDPKKKGLQHLIILAFISFSLSFYSDRRASISQIIFDFETQTQHRQNQKEKIKTRHSLIQRSSQQAWFNNQQRWDKTGNPVYPWHDMVSQLGWACNTKVVVGNL